MNKIYSLNNFFKQDLEFCRKQLEKKGFVFDIEKFSSLQKERSELSKKRKIFNLK